MKIPSGRHRFYSATRQTGVATESLEVGEALLGSGSPEPLKIISLNRIPGKHRVYNLTVQGEHIYRVSTLGVLVHNNGCQGMNNPKTASAVKLGNQVHYDQFNGGTGQQLPSALAAKYPQTKFIFTPRGAKGVDVQVVKGTPHPSTYPGSK